MPARGSWPAKQRGATRRRANVGFVTIWFERGQAYVTKTLRDAIGRRHNTFVFARMGEVPTSQGLLRAQETAGYWNVPNLTTFHSYDISLEVMTDWIHSNQLDIVVFNEEYDWDLVAHCKSLGCRVFTYLDFYREDWRDLMSIYHGVLCATRRTYDLVKGFCRAFHVGWAIDTRLFRPAEVPPEHFFFHNAGWLGINFRKNTPMVIEAFDRLSREVEDVTLLVHCQLGLDALPTGAAQIVAESPRIKFVEGTLPVPGLYTKAKVYVYPAKLDGLGLTLLEALACGLPAITTDAPPMNEFVRPGDNGFLVRVDRLQPRSFDSVAFPEAVVDIEDLVAKMKLATQAETPLAAMSHAARRFAKTSLAPDRFSESVLKALGLAP